MSRDREPQFLVDLQADGAQLGAEEQQIVLQTKALASTPASEPDWAEMTRAIREGCEAIDDARRRPLPIRWIRLLGVRRAAAWGAALAVAVVGVIALDGIADPPVAGVESAGDAGAAVAAESVRQAAPDEAPRPATLPDALRVADLVDLTDDELDALGAALDREDSTFPGEDRAWSETEHPGGDMLGDPTEHGIEPFIEPTYEWIDELSGESLERLSTYLDNVKTG